MVPIITYPDKRLTQKSEPVLSFGAEVARIAEKLEGALARSIAMGLSAPQLGINRRIIVVSSEESGPLVVVNPEISGARGVKVEDEGCLSLPGAYFKIPRPLRVVVTGRDAFGNEMRVDAAGYTARAFVHEIDHLDGMLLWDRLPPESRAAAVESFLAASPKTR
ncbi:MAG: peptide deformylase [Nitrospinae bacterium]|nr:peptide deformylase [Nitrospinota bacterium]